MIWNIIVHPIENKTLFRISSMEQQIYKKIEFHSWHNKLKKLEFKKTYVMFCWSALTKSINKFFLNALMGS